MDDDIIMADACSNQDQHHQRKFTSAGQREAALHAKTLQELKQHWRRYREEIEMYLLVCRDRIHRAASATEERYKGAELHKYHCCEGNLLGTVDIFLRQLKLDAKILKDTDAYVRLKVEVDAYLTDLKAEMDSLDKRFQLMKGKTTSISPGEAAYRAEKVLELRKEWCYEQKTIEKYFFDSSARLHRAACATEECHKEGELMGYNYSMDLVKSLTESFMRESKRDVDILGVRDDYVSLMEEVNLYLARLKVETDKLNKHCQLIEATPTLHSQRQKRNWEQRQACHGSEPNQHHRDKVRSIPDRHPENAEFRVERLRKIEQIWYHNRDCIENFLIQGRALLHLADAATKGGQNSWALAAYKAGMHLTKKCAGRFIGKYRCKASDFEDVPGFTGFWEELATCGPRFKGELDTLERYCQQIEAKLDGNIGEKKRGREREETDEGSEPELKRKRELDPKWK